MHVFAVFSGNVARGPIGLESPLAAASHRNTSYFAVDQDELEHTLEEVRGASAQRKVVRSADGANAFSMEVGPYVSYASRDGVSAVFSGEVSSWPGVDMVQVTHDAFVRGEDAAAGHTDAVWLLDLYATFADDIDSDCIDHALSALSQPLFWGSAPDGRFMFGSDPVDLAACDPTPTGFPAGAAPARPGPPALRPPRPFSVCRLARTLYASEGRQRMCSPGERGWVIAGETWPGQLLSFLRDPVKPSRWRDVKAIPRLTSQGSMCGAVYRVASERTIPIC